MRCFMGIRCQIFQKEGKKYFSSNWKELAAVPKALLLLSQFFNWNGESD